MTTNSTATQMRIQVMDLRIRLERVAADAFDRVCEPTRTARQSRPLQRLLFVLSGLPADEWLPAYRLVRLSRYVYRRSADLVHGRVGAVDISQTVLDEWRAAVTRLEALVSSRPRVAPSGPNAAATQSPAKPSDVRRSVVAPTES
jgi:hypothetical protein